MTETIGMVLDRIEAQQAKELEALPHDHTALQLGQALYRCRSRHGGKDGGLGGIFCLMRHRN